MKIITITQYWLHAEVPLSIAYVSKCRAKKIWSRDHFDFKWVLYNEGLHELKTHGQMQVRMVTSFECKDRRHRRRALKLIAAILGGSGRCAVLKNYTIESVGVVIDEWNCYNCNGLKYNHLDLCGLVGNCVRLSRTTHIIQRR